MLDKDWVGEFQTENLFLGFKIKDKVVEYRSQYQKVSIYDTYDFGRVLFLDDMVMLTERDEFVYHEMLVHPAMGLLQNPEDILIIGGGDGGTLREVLKYPVGQATVVEIDDEVVEVSKKYLPFTGRSFLDKRSRVIIQDGAKYVRETQEKYDAIFVDSADPVGPSKILFSEDFIGNLRKILKKGGIITVQSESPFYNIDVVKSYLHNIDRHFSHTLVYLAYIPTYPSGMWSFIMGRNEEIGVPQDKIEGLKYYNPVIFQASQALPNWVCNYLYPKE